VKLLLFAMQISSWWVSEKAQQHPPLRSSHSSNFPTHLSSNSTPQTFLDSSLPQLLQQTEILRLLVVEEVVAAVVEGILLQTQQDTKTLMTSREEMGFRITTAGALLLLLLLLLPLILSAKRLIDKKPKRKLRIIRDAHLASGWSFLMTSLGILGKPSGIQVDMEILEGDMRMEMCRKVATAAAIIRVQKVVAVEDIGGV